MYEMIRLSRVAWIRAQMFQCIEIIPPWLGPTLAGFPCSRMGPAAVGEEGERERCAYYKGCDSDGYRRNAPTYFLCHWLATFRDARHW